MLMPSLDFELMYWRARRRLQWLRSTYRCHVSQARAAIQLQYLSLFGRMQEPPQPEETAAYRIMWALVVVGLAGVLAIEAVGEEQFNYRMESIATAIKHFPDRRVQQPTPEVPLSLEADTDKARSIAWLKNSI